jgi:[protein-PII] uridylyltransferase
MSTQSPLVSELKERFDAESSRLQEEFSAAKDGLKYLQEKSALVDSIARRFWAQFVGSTGLQPSRMIFAAVGDYGRQTLFPYSDVDLIFLAGTGEAAEKFKDAIQRLSQGMNEIGLRCNTTAGIIPEFIQFDADRAETILSLLDCRFLDGDQELFANLRNRLIPEIMVRESQSLVERLAELTRNSHRKFANTVFHLEPNVKDGPGGFQDYVTARWLAAMSAIEEQDGWPDPQKYFSLANQTAMDSALAFFASVRCFLHFRNKRDHNLLTWDAQDDAAARKIGTQNVHATNVTDWMRIYFARPEPFLSRLPADGPARLQTQSGGRTTIGAGEAAAGRPPSGRRRFLAVSGRSFARTACGGRVARDALVASLDSFSAGIAGD